MSDVIKIRLYLEGAMVLIVAFPVLLGAPTSNLPEVQQRSDALDIAAVAPQCDKDSYLDNEKQLCMPCVPCPKGMGSTASTCGDGFGEKGTCVDCVDGDSFQDQISTKGQCNTCRLCDPNASVLANCTKYSNTECGPCNDGYGQLSNFPGLCGLCSLFNNNEKPPECLLNTTPTPPVIVPDTDECALDLSTCDTSVSTCKNTIGSYTCECVTGYVKNPLDKCIDVNECESNRDSCDASSSNCRNTNGSFTCDCLPGFEIKSSSHCVDINECDLQDSCDASVSRCTNTNGSFTCECWSGFEMNFLSHCVDVNECKLNLDSCDSSFSRCINTNGSFTCKCWPGFEMNSSSHCVDVNECKLNVDSCDTSSSRCINNNGNFTCDCLPEFEMNSSSQCVSIRSSGINVAAIAVSSSICLVVLLLLVPLAIWCCRKKSKGERVLAKQQELTSVATSWGNDERQENDLAPSTSDSGNMDSTALVPSDSPQAITIGNRQTLITSAETQCSDASDAGRDESSPLLVKRVNISSDVPDTPGDEGNEVVEPNTGTDFNDDEPLPVAQGNDSPTANGHTSNSMPDTPEDDDGDEVEEPNTDTDLNALPLSAEESTKSDEYRDTLGPVKKTGGDRPVFKRSQSMPATMRNENSEKIGKASLLMSECTQKSLVANKSKADEDQFKVEYQEALRLGAGLKWVHLDWHFKKKINQEMKSENNKNDFRTFGELMGLNRNTDLKDCNDLFGVFDQLNELQATEVCMDKVLQTLRIIPRYDVVRMIIGEIISKKHTWRGE